MTMNQEETILREKVYGPVKSYSASGKKTGSSVVITIPMGVRRKNSIDAGDEFIFISRENSEEIILEPVEEAEHGGK